MTNSRLLFILGCWVSLAFTSCNKIYGLSSAGLDVIGYPTLQVEKTLVIPEAMAGAATNVTSSFHMFFDDGQLFIANSVIKSGVAIFWVTKFDV